MWFAILISVAVGLMVLRLPFRQAKVWGPVRCKRCGYIVAGIEGRICPECGADLRLVGTTTRDGFLPPGRAYLAVAWSVFVLLGVWVPLMAVYERYVEPRLPRVLATQFEFELESWPQEPGRWHEYQMSWKDESVGYRPGPPKTLTVRLMKGDEHHPLATPEPLRLDVADDQQGTMPGRVRNWAEAHGLDPSVEQNGHELLAIERFAHVAFTTSADQVSDFPRKGLGLLSLSGGGSVTPRPWGRFVLIPLAVAAGVWVAGLWWVLRRKWG